MQAQLFNLNQNLNKTFSKVCCHFVAAVMFICSIGTNATGQANLLVPDTVKGCTANSFQLSYVATGTAHTVTLAATITNNKYCSGVTSTADPVHIELGAGNNGVTLAKVGNDWIFTL